MRIHAPDVVSVTWVTFPPVPGIGALDLGPGLSAGTFISVQRDNPTWTYKPVGVGSNSVRMFNPNQGGLATVQMDGESAEHGKLTTLANLDFIGRSVSGVMSIYDGNTQEATFLNKTTITAIPGQKKGTGLLSFAWVFHFDAIAQQPFGFNNNVVGQ